MKLYIKRSPDSAERDLFSPEKYSEIIEVASKDIFAQNPWDIAHETVKSPNDVIFAEPLFDYVTDIGLPDSMVPTEVVERSLSEAMTSVFDEDWEFPEEPTIWHLLDTHSELATAYNAVKDLNPDVTIRVAHFDTGYDPHHAAKPAHIRLDLQRNFVEEDRPNDATDPNSNAGAIANPGHGTGTSGILAGGIGKIPTGQLVQIGAAPFVEVIPLRISNTVVLIKSDAFAEALNYVISLYDNPQTRIHIVTMSMGGVASKAWADAVNEAYEKGIFIVTAAGNNFGRLTPRTLIYPARFNRVVAACGITFDKRPYSKVWGGNFKEMQGNYGPLALMRTAMAAFTPNTPWASFGKGDEVSLQGAGTSSATPQIAAAAAIYLKKYYHELENLEGWQQVEIIRQALFNSAEKNGLISIDDTLIDDEKKRFYFGNGHLRAFQSLSQRPADLAASVEKEKEDEVFLPFWRAILGTRDLFVEEKSLDPTEQMYQIEILQLIQISPKLQAILDYEEKTLDQLSNEELQEFINEILGMKEASESLKEFLRKSK